MTPEQALLAKMEEFDLRPPGIVFDHKIHRFKAAGDKGQHRSGSGWVRAFSDRRGAVFGCYRTGVDEGWQLEEGNGKTPPTEEEKVEWEAQRKAREVKRQAKQDAAAIKAQDVWRKAEKAEAAHPYLQAKGIKPTGLRQKKKVLIAPMRGEDNKIVSLQTITENGRKRFMEDGWIKGTMASIGSRTSREVIYVTEGWATGATITEVTGAPVAISYYADNLMAVTKRMAEKFPDSTLVIAADNDHWSKTRKGRNPGVIAANEAAEATGARVAIPSFPETVCQDPDCKERCDQKCGKGHPTDFNDLMLLEGKEAVLKWLDPTAVVPIEAAPSTEVVAPAPAAEVGYAYGWNDMDSTSPFRCLGYDRDSYFYLPKGGGQIATRTVAQHDRRHLRNLAEASWWEHTFPGRGQDPVNWNGAADAMFMINHRRGVFRMGKLRGRGCWSEKDADGSPGVLLHLGDSLLPAGEAKFVPPETYVCRAGQIYEQRGRLDGPDRHEALGLEAAQEILGLFNDLLWMDEASGALLAGWTALAPLCGALLWRPHVWVTGGSGAGKTQIIKALVLPLLGGRRQEHGMAEYVEGFTTEAGIRAGLQSDARPVIYDEADRDDQKSDGRVQSVLALARSSSSSGASVQKGTPSGKGMSFEVRAMFMLSSIAGALRQEADKTRISILQLESVPQDKEAQAARRAHWKKYLPRMQKVTTAVGRQLMARTLLWLRDGRMTTTIETMKNEAAVVLGDQRSGDQYGTLFAGAWSMMADEPPDPGEARELIASHGLSTYLSEQAPEGERVLRKLLQHTVRIDRKDGAPSTHAVGELIEVSMPGSMHSGQDDATRFLKMVGIRCDVDNGEKVVLLANTSEWIAGVLRDSMYADSWTAALRSLPGVRAGKGAVRFHAGQTSRVTIVPQDAFD